MAVDIKNLEICIKEAERFLGRAKECLYEQAGLKAQVDHNGAIIDREWPDTRLTAAVRRSSMDLTRALAALRDYRR